MPLLTSPIDGSPMRQLNRFGIELDICPTSGGIWLDRGELEKLMALIKQSIEEETHHVAQQPAYTQTSQHAPLPKGHFRDDDDDDDDNRGRYYASQQQDYRDNEGYRKAGYKKKSGMSRLMEVFDF